MNWTEGSLARHSRRKGCNPGLARQKEYFAKARGAKKSTSSTQSAFLPSYITRTTPSRPSSSAVELPAAPLLSSASKRSQNTSEAPSAPNSTTGSGALEPGVDSGARNASPTCASHAKNEAKRRRLLQQNDWTGITRSKPPEINFDHIRHDYLSIKNSTKPISMKLDYADQNTDQSDRQRDWGHSHHEGGAMGSIRMRIGNRKLKWSHAGGSTRTARTLLSSSTAKSPPVAFSIPSSPPISASVLSWSSPKVRSSSPVSATRLKNRSTKIWKHQSPKSSAVPTSSAAPFVPDGPRYVVQSVPPNILIPTPKLSFGLGLSQRSSPTTTGSLVCEAGESPQISASDRKAEAEWKAFLRRRNASIRDSNEADGLHYLVANAHRVDEDQSGRSATRCQLRGEDGDRDAMPAPKFQLQDDPDTVHGQNGCEGPSKNDQQDSPSSRARSSRVPGKGESIDCHSLDQWVEDPEIRDMLSGRYAPQNMMELLDKRLQTLTERETETHPRPKTQSASEEELWKMFLLDDDPAKIVQRSQHLAAEETIRQVMEERFAIPSDEVEAPSTILDRAAEASDREESYVVEVSNASDSGLDCTGLTDECESTEAESMVAKHGSPPPDEAKSISFKIHVPTPFVGRLARTSAGQTSSGVSCRGASYATKGVSRSKRRWKSGRPEIRAMPDCDEDPIEEDV